MEDHAVRFGSLRDYFRNQAITLTVMARLPIAVQSDFSNYGSNPKAETAARLLV